MNFVDALIIGLVLAFVISRFFSFKLPKDPRKPADRRLDWQNLGNQFGEKVTTTKPETQPAPKATKSKKPNLKGLSGLQQIRALDEEFDEATFKQGTEAAYKYFYKCWNALDEEGLDSLCAPELMDQLRDGMEEYRVRGAKPEVLVNKVQAVEITQARVSGTSGIIEVEISARQSEGEVGVDKADQQALPHDVKVVWVLARALASEDPNWELQSISYKGAKA